MAPTRRQFLGAATASAVVGLSGCSGDGTGTPTDTPADTPMETVTDATTAPPADDEAASPTVAVESHPDHGEILVDDEGMVLYMFDRDTRGDLASTCSDGCAEAWPPLTVEGAATASEGVSATVETFDRADGSTQVAANGWPLYYFQSDAAPGEANGHGVNDAWWVLGPDGVPKRPRQASVQVRSHPDHGDVLVDGDGMTLYMFDSDTKGEAASACYDGCAEAWPPLTTETDPARGDGVSADLGTFERADGTRQVVAGGWPLYYFASDAEPGDVAGQGVNDVWWVLDPTGQPRRGGSTNGDGSSAGGY